MNNIKKFTLLAVIALMPQAAIHAQQALRSAYFLDGYTFRHRMNPAIAGESNYVSMPVLGNLNVGAQSTVGVSDFLYKYNGGLTTFMNESVSANKFLGGLRSNNRLNVDLSETILSAGFFTLGGYNTVEINVRSTTSMNLPRELFAFMKRGMTSSQTSYNIGDFGVSSTNYAEIALGHSRNIIPNLNVGAKVKILLGLAQATAKIKDMKINMSDNEWKIQSQGELAASVKGLIVPTKKEAGRDYDPGEEDLISWDDIDTDNLGLNGGGLAFDLGATYQLYDFLELSAAFTDIGFIKWKNATNARTADTEWSFDGFHEVGLTGDSDNQIDDQLDDLGTELEDFFNFHKTGKTSGKARALGATMTLGALYTIPLPNYKDRLKVGFLSTTRIQGSYSWSEGRFSANWFPCKSFDASVSYAISTFGSSFGWVLNAHHRGINFFVGSDHMFFKITPQFLPVHHANTNISLGINFPFGARKTLASVK